MPPEANRRVRDHLPAGAADLAGRGESQNKPALGPNLVEGIEWIAEVLDGESCEAGRGSHLSGDWLRQPEGSQASASFLARAARQTFMALNFAGKQTEHARSVLVLKDQMDAFLIARGMFEGLSQLLWATQLPSERPLRWRTFAFVRDWHTMRKQEQAGIDVTPERRAYIENGLEEYGDLFLMERRERPRTRGGRSGMTPTR